MFLLNSFLSSSRSFTWGRFLIPIGVVLCLLQALQPAQAQSGVDFPTKPVKLVVAYAAGGTTDHQVGGWVCEIRFAGVRIIELYQNFTVC